MTFFDQLRAAFFKHRHEAQRAQEILDDFCGGRILQRVPGMDTIARLAWRIECGHNAESAAGKEYFYRWNLALRSRIFGVPHTIGM